MIRKLINRIFKKKEEPFSGEIFHLIAREDSYYKIVPMGIAMIKGTATLAFVRDGYKIVVESGDLVVTKAELPRL